MYVHHIVQACERGTTAQNDKKNPTTSSQTDSRGYSAQPHSITVPHRRYVISCIRSATTQTHVVVMTTHDSLQSLTMKSRVGEISPPCLSSTFSTADNLLLRKRWAKGIDPPLPGGEAGVQGRRKQQEKNKENEQTPVTPPD